MNELPDDRLDELFRKSAEELKPAYDPADWDSLRERLDDSPAPTGTGQLRKWWLGGGLLLLLLAGGLGTYYRSTTTDAEEQRAATTSGKPVAEAAQPQMDTDKSRQGPQQSMIPVRTEGRVAIPAASAELKGLTSTENQEQNAQKIQPRRQPDASGVRLQSTLSGRAEGDGASHQNRDKGTAQQRIRSKGELLSNQAEKIADGLGTVESGGEGLAATASETTWESVPEENQVQLNRVMEVAPLLPRLTYQTNHHFAAPVVSPGVPGPVVKYRSPAAKWAVRLGVSPDMSSVGLRDFTSPGLSRPGPSASLLIDYSVTSRLYLQTGVIRSLKTYQALPGQYEWPAYWNQYVKPSSVDGDCQVLEIPLNLRYDIEQGTRSTWFVGTGLSSYRMQKEIYKYHYERPDPSIKRWRWEGQTGWYWLSHLNASVGYEYHLSDRLSLLAEPYVRLPLRKIGYGKVNLFTTGMWVSVRYRPVRGK
ncbi:hypothetical protein [Telluribacter sp.]|jgi:hypothetical protein|uniref:hypothetical protein n=1 Tax=Telluribacter sp. TaxID=1978767 RepID=UPI002E142A6F|nr:hypothetical protein [Telluribacter sp.]